MKRFSFKFNVFLSALLLVGVSFSVVTVSRAVTPNPGHGWAEVGDGVFQVTGPTSLRTFTFPDADATIATIDEVNAVLPDQTGNGGKFLKTDGSDVSWASIPGGGDALTSNPLSQFASTTSLQLSSVISDETGSGALVFANSPTFTTPNIGSATGSISGNAGTATALQANGANCTAGSAPLGVDASGAAESCTDFEEDLGNSAGLAAALSDETGTGLAVFNDSPTFITPVLGSATATSISTPLITLTGTGTLNGLDAIDGVTEATLEAALELQDLQGAVTDAQVPNTITIDLAAAATALATNPADCAANTFATTIAANGDLTCASIGDADVPNTITIDLATLASTVTVVDSTDATSFIAMFDSATGSLATKTDAGLTYNASTGVLTATGFSGPLTGNVTGNLTGNADTASDLVCTNCIGPNEITDLTLGTDTAGNFVATITDSGGNTIAVTNSGTENAGVTLGIVADSIGDTQLAFNTGQHLTTSSGVTFSTVDTGQGANELYDMDQNVLTTSGVTFNTVAAATFTGALSGNATTATALATNPSDCAANTFATTIAANGNLTCAGITDADVPNDITIDLATLASTVTFADAGGDTTTFVALGTNATGSLAPATDAGLTYNATTNALTASTFVGALTGNADTASDLVCTNCIGPTEISDLTLGTDTAGNYVATIADSGAGTISVANSGSESAAVTLGIVADSIGDTQLAFNTGQHLTSTSAVTFLTLDTGQGANELYDMDQNVLQASNVTFNSVTGTTLAGSGTKCLQVDNNGLISLASDACGTASGATSWTDLGDATSDTTIALGGFETDFTSSLDANGKAIWTITNTDADTANNTDFISLAHNDGADANVFYLRAVGDADGTPQTDYLFSQTAATIRPDLTVTGAIAASNFSGTSSGTNTGDQTNISGNAGTATALAADPSDCSSNQFATTIAANGNLTCAGITDADVPNTITIDLATLASTVTVVDSTDATSFVAIFDSATGSLATKTDGALLYDASNGTLSATTFSGALTGNATTASALAANAGNCSAGSGAGGVSAAGLAEDCTDYEEDLSNSAGLAAALSDETGTGVAVFNDSPTFITPTLGAATATSISTPIITLTGTGTLNGLDAIDATGESTLEGVLDLSDLQGAVTDGQVPNNITIDLAAAASDLTCTNCIGPTEITDLTLGTDTAGNYVATIADSGASTITVNNSGAENAGVTLGITGDSIGDTQLAFNTGQNLTSSSAVTFATVDTGQGANELYDMNQNVLTTSDVTFNAATLTSLGGSGSQCLQVDDNGIISATGDACGTSTGISSFNVLGDTGSVAITEGNNLTIAGSSTITTAAAAVDTVSISVTGDSIGDTQLAFNTGQHLTTSSGVTFGNVTDSGLTSGRVTFAGASGLLSDDAGLTYNSGTDTLTTTTFVGALTGNASTASALVADPSDCSANQFATTIAANGNLTCASISDADVPNNITIDLATLASTVTVVDSTDASSSIAMFDSATGSLAVKTDGALTYNASTGALTATTFVGAVTGAATDLNCTDCINATEIEDIYLLNTGDTSTGAITINDNNGSSSALLTVGDSNDLDNVVVYGNVGIGDSTPGSPLEILASNSTADTGLLAANITLNDSANAGAGAGNYSAGIQATVNSSGTFSDDSYTFPTGANFGVNFSGTIEDSAGSSIIGLYGSANFTGTVTTSAYIENIGGIFYSTGDMGTTGFTTHIGVKIGTINATADENVGVDIGRVSSADSNIGLRLGSSGGAYPVAGANNYAIYSGAPAQSYFAGNIGIGDASPLALLTVGSGDVFQVDGSGNVTAVSLSTPTLTLTGTGTINGLDAIDPTTETTLETEIDIAGDVDGTGLGSVDLDEVAVETELEGVLDLENLQGAVTDAQVPNNITIDLATLASTVTVVDSTDATSFIAMFDSATGSLAAKTDGALLYDASNGNLTATTFTGALAGNATTASALAANGANCSAGSGAGGVSAVGLAEDCTDYEEDLSNSAGLLAALSDETGTGVAVFNDSPTFADDFNLAAAGVKFTGADGVLTLLGLGDGNDENLTIDLDNAAANTVAVGTGTGVTGITFGSIGLSSDTLTLTGTGTINGLDAIDATTETTLEAAVDIAGDVTGTGLGSVDLDEAAVEAELESVMDLSDLQGAVTDAQVPNTITIDLATLASTVTVVDSTDATSFVAIFDSATGSLAAKTDGALLYNASNGTLTATTFSGALSGNATTASALAANGSNCSAGSGAGGVSASGVAEDCTDYEEDLSNSAGLAAALSDETGSSSGVAVFSNSPVFTDDITLGSAGVLLAGDGDGDITFTGIGDGTTDNDEDFTLNLEDAANTISVSSSTGVTLWDFGTLDVSTDTLTLTGTGTINGLDAIDGTSETTLEGAIDIAGDVDGTGLTAVDIDEVAVEAELESVMDLQDLQGAVTDAQVPNNITIDLATLASTVTVVDSTDATSFIAMFDSATGSLAAKTDGGLLYASDTGTLAPTILSTATVTLTGTGTINGLDAIDATTEATIETQVFDADAKNITGVWEVQDDVDFVFGNDANWAIQYDEGVDDQLLFVTAGTTATATTDPLFEILVGTTPTADQQVFGVAKGSQATNTELFSVDEDGDGVFAGALNMTGTLTMGGTGTLNGLDAIDATGETTLEAAIDIVGDVDGTGLGAVDLDELSVEAELEAVMDLSDLQGAVTDAQVPNTITIDLATLASTVTVVDSTDATSFIAMFDSATGSLAAKTDGGLLYAADTGTLAPTILSTATVTLTGTGTINGLDAVDATGEDTIEALIFDADAQDISGTWEVQDDVDFVFGNDADWKFNYDESVDDQLLISTTKTATAATTDPMFEILSDFGTSNGTGMTANQQVFGVAKGTQASNISLFTVDEDGDGIFAGTLDVTGGLVIDATTETNIEAAADIAGDVDGTGLTNVDIDEASVEAELESVMDLQDLQGAVTDAQVPNTITIDLATLASTVTVVDSTDATSSIAMFDSATGSLAAKTDGGLTYNASTGVLTATGFAGPLTGNVTGSATDLNCTDCINATEIEDIYMLNSGDTSTGDITIAKQDPAVIFNAGNTSDTKFWAGVTDDNGNDDDDLFQIGDGTSPGTNAFLTIDTNGNVGINDATPSGRLDVTSAAGRFAYLDGGTPLVMVDGGKSVALISGGSGSGLVYDSSSFFQIASDTDGNISGGTTSGGSQKFLIDSSGRTWILGIPSSASMTLGSQTGIGLGIGSDQLYGLYFGVNSGTGNAWIQNGRTDSATAYDLSLQAAGGDVSIGTTGSDRKLEINDASGNNLRLTYNDADGSATNYVDFLTTSGGNLTITPSGGTAIIGQTELGSWPSSSSFAYFGNQNLDHSVAGNYALLQDTAGGTYLNAASGQVIEFRINNGAVATLNSSSQLRFGPASNAIISLYDSAVNSHQFFGLKMGADILGYQVGATTGNHVFYAGTSSTTSNELMRLTGAGSLGLGTSAPDKALEINSSDGNNLRLTYNDSNGSAANYVDFLTSSSGDLTLTPSGNDVLLLDSVGLNFGTGSDLEILHNGTNSTITNSTGTLEINGAASSEVVFNESGADVNFRVEGDTKTNLIFADAGTDKVGIGNAGPLALLHVGSVNQQGGTLFNVGSGNYNVPDVVDASPISFQPTVQLTADSGGMSAVTFSPSIGDDGSPHTLGYLKGLNIVDPSLSPSTTITQYYPIYIGSTTGTIMLGSKSTCLGMGGCNQTFNSAAVVIGSGHTDVPDITSATGIVGLKVVPTMQMLGGNSASMYGTYINPTWSDDGSARTLTTGYASYIGAGAKDAATTVTNQYGLYVEDPTVATNNYSAYFGGKVGIGDTTPDAKLDVEASNATNEIGLSITGLNGGGGTGTQTSLSITQGMDNNSSAVALKVANTYGGSPAGYLAQFNANGTDVFLINAIGRIGVGTTPGDPSIKIGGTHPTTGNNVVGAAIEDATVTSYSGDQSAFYGAYLHPSITQAGGAAGTANTFYGLNVSPSFTNSGGTLPPTSYGLWVNPTNSGTITSYSAIFQGGKIGMGTTAPDRALEINDASGNNLRLTYNDSNGSAANYVDLLTTSGGDFTITPSGGDVDINGTLTVDSCTGCGGGTITGTDTQVLFFDGNDTPAGDAGLTYNKTTDTLTAATFVGALTGNVTGNVSGTAATVTGAAQTAITSLGTLTALQVDNLNLNGNTISATSGAVNITPEAGSAILLDGTISIDAGVVTGATSISSTTFVGALTGAATDLNCTDCIGATEITDDYLLNSTSDVMAGTLTADGLTLGDDENITLGTSSDWTINFDDSVDDQLLFATNNNGSIATTDPMFEILADFDTANGTNITADQQVFGVAKGTQASNVALFTVDEDGDGVFAGTLDATGGITINATTESNIESAIDTAANLTSVQGRTVTLADAGANAIFGWDDTAGAYENLTQGEVLAIIGNAAADGSTKGVAAFNATNFSASSGVINTIQNIATSSTPQFAGLEINHASANTLSASGGHLTIEGATVWDSGNDGSGSTLDADLLDGKNIGTSGNTIPLLDGSNTWSAQQLVADDIDFVFGSDSDWKIQYDEGVDNQLLFYTLNTSAVATTDPMFEILADFGNANGTTMTSGQQIFGVSKGTQASNVSLFSVAEDGLTTIGDSGGSGDANFQFGNDTDGWSVGFFDTDNSFRIADETDLSADVAFTILKGGNVGINTTAPQSLLDVQGAAGAAGTLTLATKELTVVDGDVLGRINFNAPLESDGTDAILVGASIAAVAEGTFSASNNATELIFYTGASEAATQKMVITSAGLVGMGTSAPANALDINSATGANLQLTYNDSDGSASNKVNFAVSSSGDLTLTPSGGDMTFVGRALVNGLTSNGINLGGESQALLQGTSGSTNAGLLFGFTNAASVGGLIGMDVGGNMFIRSSSSTATPGSSDQRLTILIGGNVGIGTTAPANALDINSATGANLQLTYNDSDGSAANKVNFAVSSGGNLTITPTGGTLNVNNQVIIADASGNPGALRIGTAEKGMLYYDGTDFAMQSNNYGLNIQSEGSSYIRFRRGATETMRITGAGSVGIGDDSPDALFDVKGTVCLDINADEACTDGTATLSDSRLKTNVTDLTDALSLVGQLRPVRFDWNGTYNVGTDASLGFIAQEVEEIFPELVITDTAGYKNLDYSKLTAVLAGAIQEMNQNIQAISVEGLENTEEAQAFADGFFKNLFIRITAWLGDQANGVAQIYANVISSETVYTKELCIEDLCIDKEDLQRILDNTGGGGSAPQPEADQPSDETPSLEPEPTGGEEEITAEGGTPPEAVAPEPESIDEGSTEPEPEEVLPESDPNTEVEETPAPESEEEVEPTPEPTPEVVAE